MNEAIIIDIITIILSLIAGGFVGRYLIPTKLSNVFMKKEIAKKQKRLERLTEKLDNITRK